MNNLPLNGSSYHTARKYLELLTEQGLLKKEKIWKTNYYINIGLIKQLVTIENEPLQFRPN